MADVVWGEDLLDDVEVARVVVELLDLPTYTALFSSADIFRPPLRSPLLTARR